MATKGAPISSGDIKKVDGYIESLMKCKPLAEDDVKAL